jgi:hypothetical protein
LGQWPGLMASMPTTTRPALHRRELYASTCHALPGAVYSACGLCTGGMPLRDRGRSHALLLLAGWWRQGATCTACSLRCEVATQSCGTRAGWGLLRAAMVYSIGQACMHTRCSFTCAAMLHCCLPMLPLASNPYTHPPLALSCG